MHTCRPKIDEKTVNVEAQISRKRTRTERSDSASIERGVRQLLADKVSGNLAGIWLLVAEHMRLGTWDLLRGWTNSSEESVEARLAMQIVNESAVCTSGIRSGRTLNGRGGFELACGLPFVASDTALHDLLNQRSVESSQELQVALGLLRKSMGHFRGKLLVIDPHRVKSHSRRRMRERSNRGSRPVKQAQSFWLLDGETHQPVCFTTATAATSVVEATPMLMRLGERVLLPSEKALVLADSEHFSSELLHAISGESPFDLLVPIPNQPVYLKRWRSTPSEDFRAQWAGFATMKKQYNFKYGAPGEYFEIVERFGEKPAEYRFKGFLCTKDVNEVDALTVEYPIRWHIEEFFNAFQSLGWKKAGTQNLNVRYGQMTLALIAQAAISELRRRLGQPFENWDADHFAKDLFFRLEGDVRVTDDTIVVTYYNAPNKQLLQEHYEHLPEKLAAENVPPTVPWLYGYKLDFRFR